MSTGRPHSGPQLRVPRAGERLPSTASAGRLFLLIGENRIVRQYPLPATRARKAKAQAADPVTPEPGILAVAGACLGRALVGDTQLCSSDSLPVMSPESWRTPCRLTPATVSCLKHKCAHVSGGQRDVRGTAVGSQAGASVLRCPGAHKRNRELAEEASGARASRGPLSGTKGASGQLLVPWRQPSNPDQAHWGSLRHGPAARHQSGLHSGRASKRAHSLPSSRVGEPDQVH